MTGGAMSHSDREPGSSALSILRASAAKYLVTGDQGVNFKMMTAWFLILFLDKF
jgi:hypothetical protein